MINGLTRRGVPLLLVVLPDGSRSLIPSAWTDGFVSGGVDAPREVKDGEDFSVEELTHMPGSSTTQDRICARVDAHARFAFRCDNGVGVPIDSFAAQWLAYAHPCRRFAAGLATDDARLGADAVRYSFIVVDLHHLLLAGLPAHRHRNHRNPNLKKGFR